MSGFFISPEELLGLIARGAAPAVFDVRRRPVFDRAQRVLPAARWRDHTRVQEWQAEAGSDPVVYCQHGHNVSQLAGADMRAQGIRARVLQGGIEAWTALNLPTVGKSPHAPPEAEMPSRWVTRLRPKVDRIACPWFIRRFVDPSAEFLFVEPEQVLAVAEEAQATAFDIEGAPIEHDGERCSFDTLLDHFAVDDPALRRLALIVRGADTGRPDLAPEASGLLAASLGVSAMADGDHEALHRGFALYDALHAWLRLAASEAHGWPPRRAA